ncbi:RDD family protein [Halohasta litorea]|uniref:RDD family protein n=1 Tax=Halohasta litorea TaxID=869891 RepID=A0ABD6D9U4_9EURY|nr:RDD family protein [Halohasta litorea]
MSSPRKLGLFGVIHIDRLSKVTRELEAFVGDSETIFIESPTDSMGLRQYGSLFARVPAYAFGALLLQLAIYTPLFLLFNRDLLPTELAAARRVADSNGLSVQAVDEHPNETLSRAGPRLIVLNWLVFGVVGWLEPVATAATAAVAVGGGLVPILIRRRGHRYGGLAAAICGLGLAGWLVAEGLWSVWLFCCGLLFVVVIVWTLDHRNEVMLDRIEERSTEADYDEAVLVTGKAHLGGLASLASGQELAVPRVHISRWLRAGTTITDFEPEDLPTIGRKTLAPTNDLTPNSGLGPLARRVGAAVVDLLVVGIPTAVLWVVFAVVASIATSDPTATVGAVLIGFPAVMVVGYHVLLEWRFGTTVGKRLFGLVVVDRAGDDISGRSALARNLLRPVSLLGGYLVGGLLVAVTSRHQHLGDRLAGTVVVAGDRSTDSSAEPDDTGTTESAQSNQPPAASNS